MRRAFYDLKRSKVVCPKCEAPFTVDNELMTPTLKVRRHKVLEIYRDGLEARPPVARHGNDGR